MLFLPSYPPCAIKTEQLHQECRDPFVCEESTLHSNFTAVPSRCSIIKCVLATWTYIDRWDNRRGGSLSIHKAWLDDVGRAQP
ncbi:hypothetical protein CEXT_447621 [Caerostris extrusa]|uniref:Uncharacterized protein n=1 Tax=Caerostris extrusa TaxID=172846 RepID=A0AAV4VLA2_CAEEX|nr:hypothetical protein CEXT_447621 [Caerostris extrusa]